MSDYDIRNLEIPDYNLPDGDYNLNPREWPWWCWGMMPLCANYYGWSAVADRVETQNELIDARDAAVIAAAQAGAARSQADQAGAQLRAIGISVAPVAVTMFLVLGLVGGYVWYRGRQQKSTSSLSQLSDEELERMIYEKEIEAGI